MRDLYFGYGSNLDFEDWSAFCAERGFDPFAMRPVGPAVLPGEALVFDYHSSRRGCGALNLRPLPGGAVDGYLFEIADWAALDLKEGHPTRYRREPVVVLDPAGAEVTAQTYRVIPEMRVGLVPPNAHYLAVCRAGRTRFGLSLAGLEAAAAAALAARPARPRPASSTLSRREAAR